MGCREKNPFNVMARGPLQEWVLLSQESESNYPLQAAPPFRALFNRTMTFHRSADVTITYADRPYLSGARRRSPAAPRQLLSVRLVRGKGRGVSN